MYSLLFTRRGLSGIVVLCFCLGLGLVGCGKGGGGKSIANSESAMASADPAIKAKWDNAIAASKSNEYAGAIIVLKTIVDDPKLNPDQKTAVQNAMEVISDQMYEALNRGDAKAQKAIEELRKASGR